MWQLLVWLKDYLIFSFVRLACVQQLQENYKLKEALHAKEQEVAKLDGELVAAERQVHRQAAVIMLFIKRLRENNISDSISENDKPKLGEDNV